MDTVRALDPERRIRRPAPEAWHALEIVEHLVRAEESVLGDVLRTGTATSSGRRTLRHRLRYAIVMFVLRFGVDVRAPSRRMLPTGEGSLDEWAARWDENHARLRAFVAGCSADDLRRAVFRHPISGPLTVVQGVRMLDVHLRRHEGQLAAALDAD